MNKWLAGSVFEVGLEIKSIVCYMCMFDWPEKGLTIDNLPDIPQVMTTMGRGSVSVRCRRGMRTSGIEVEDGSCPAIFYVPFIIVLLARHLRPEHEELLKLKSQTKSVAVVVGTLKTNTH
jgi:hypothetical protein